MAFNNYDPQKVTLSFAGIIVTGFAADTFISIERTEDSFSMDVGSQGDVTRVRSRDRTGSVTFTLQAGATVNQLLSSQQQLDELTGAGTGPMQMKDLNGTTLCTAAISWLRRPANVERASGPSNNEWVLDCETLTMNVGGFVT